MQEIIIRDHQQLRLFGCFTLLIAIENLFPPDTIRGHLGLRRLYDYIYRCHDSMGCESCHSTAGSVAGALILYTIGRGLNAQRLESLFNSKAAQALRLGHEDVREPVKWFNKHGNRAAIFFASFYSDCQKSGFYPRWYGEHEIAGFSTANHLRYADLEYSACLFREIGRRGLGDSGFIPRPIFIDHLSCLCAHRAGGSCNLYQAEVLAAELAVIA